jgi:hypothetical protein
MACAIGIRFVPLNLQLQRLGAGVKLQQSASGSRMSASGQKLTSGSLAGMSAKCHKQTLEQASEMSALPTKADMRLAIQKCPLSAKSRTLPSQSCPPQSNAPLAGE